MLDLRRRSGRGRRSGRLVEGRDRDGIPCAVAVVLVVVFQLVDLDLRQGFPLEGCEHGGGQHRAKAATPGCADLLICRSWCGVAGVRLVVVIAAVVSWW